MPAWIVGFWQFLISTEVTAIATLVGTGASIWVLLSVRTIRAHFLFTARVPQILEDLQANVSAMNACLADYENSQDVIDVELAKCLANLNNLHAKITTKTKKSIKRVCGSIEKYQGTEVKSKEDARSIYTSLNGLMQELKNLREDTRWSDANAG